MMGREGYAVGIYTSTYTLLCRAKAAGSVLLTNIGC